MPGSILKQKARPFDPHRRVKSDKLRAIVDDVLNQVQTYEAYHKTRERSRSPADQANFEAMVEAIVCDLACRHTELPGGQVHLSQSNQVLRKKSRYKGAAMGKTLPDILKVMKAPEMEFVAILPGLRDFKILDDGVSYAVSGVTSRGTRTKKCCTCGQRKFGTTSEGL